MCGSVRQCVAVCGSVWQCVAACGSVWQCMAVRGSVWQCVAVCGSVWQFVAVCCSMWQYVEVCCSVLKCVAVCCSVWQCVPGVPVASFLSRKSFTFSYGRFHLKCLPPTFVQRATLKFSVQIHIKTHFPFVSVLRDTGNLRFAFCWILEG